MIRREVTEQIRFLAEPIVWALLLLGCLWMALRLSATAGWIVVAVPLVLACVAGAGFWIAIAKLRLHPSGHEKGVVLVDERRVGFFDPDHEGGFVDLDALMRLEIRGELGGRAWVLYHEDGPPLTISQHAPGAEQLLDVFSTLSGLSIARFSRAFEAPYEDVQLLWEREPDVSPRVFH